MYPLDTQGKRTLLSRLRIRSASPGKVAMVSTETTEKGSMLAGVVSHGDFSPPGGALRPGHLDTNIIGDRRVQKDAIGRHSPLAHGGDRGIHSDVINDDGGDERLKKLSELSSGGGDGDRSLRGAGMVSFIPWISIHTCISVGPSCTAICNLIKKSIRALVCPIPALTFSSSIPALIACSFNDYDGDNNNGDGECRAFRRWKSGHIILSSLGWVRPFPVRQDEQHYFFR